MGAHHIAGREDHSQALPGVHRTDAGVCCGVLRKEVLPELRTEAGISAAAERVGLHIVRVVHLQEQSLSKA